MKLFMHLAKNDILKIKEVTELNYIFVLNFLTIEKEQIKEQEKIQRQYECKIQRNS